MREPGAEGVGWIGFLGVISGVNVSASPDVLRLYRAAGAMVAAGVHERSMRGGRQQQARVKEAHDACAERVHHAFIEVPSNDMENLPLVVLRLNIEKSYYKLTKTIEGK